jgi:hypothetical protein
MRSSIFLVMAVPGLLLMGSCRGPKDPTPSRPPVVDLGAVELTNGIPTRRFYLGSGENVFIVPTVLRDGRLDLRAEFDRGDATGKQHRLAYARVQTPPGHPTELSFQFIRFTLVPTLER